MGAVVFWGGDGDGIYILEGLLDGAGDGGEDVFFEEVGVVFGGAGGCGAEVFAVVISAGVGFPGCVCDPEE